MHQSFKFSYDSISQSTKQVETEQPLSLSRVTSITSIFMSNRSIPDTPSDYHHYIAQSVASIYACLLNDTTVAKINTLTMNVAEDMAREVDYQLHKMQSLKALLHVRVREAKHEEEKRRASTVDTAWGELQRKREASEVHVNIKSPMTPRGLN